MRLKRGLNQGDVPSRDQERSANGRTLWPQVISMSHFNSQELRAETLLGALRTDMLENSNTLMVFRREKTLYACESG